MSRPIRIANCSGFFGDRLSAAAEMVDGGPIDVLTGDWLAELTMLILARRRFKHPGGGYATTFLTQMEQVLGTCLDRNIKVVTNAGGLDPDGCANALAELATTLGLAPKIAYVHGDDLSGRVQTLIDAGEPLNNFDTDDALGDRAASILTANAYLGCWGIVDALNAEADVVITGRVTDAALVCGPAAWWHGWARDQWNELAGAVVAGHVIECGSQATGGNYSFFTEVPGMTRVGFPFAEIAEDGSSVISKHEGTGGEVSVGTVTSQLLYEIGGPHYLGPDVTARFDSVHLAPVGHDRVEITGVVGEPPPKRLKVALNYVGGYRNEAAIALCGLDIEAKAALVEEAFWVACPFAREDFAQVTTRVERTEHVDPTSNEAALATWRIIVKDPDQNKVGRAFSNTVVELALATIPGMFGTGGGPGAGSPYGVYWPTTVDRSAVQQLVTILGGETSIVDDPPHFGEVVIDVPPTALAPENFGPTIHAPIGRLVGARSGDKGGNANLGVFARTQPQWEWLRRTLTTDMLRELLPECAGLEVERYEFANLMSLNFVIRGLLEEGVAAATRRDAQAKSLGEWLRARVVDVPETLL